MIFNTSMLRYQYKLNTAINLMLKDCREQVSIVTKTLH